VVTLMNAPHGVTEDASNLLTWTFKNYTKLNPVGTLVKPAAAAQPRAETGTTEGKITTGTTSTAHPPRSRTVLNPGQAVQSLAFRVPAWVYAAPPVLLLGLFLRRPKALRRRRH